MADTPLPNVDDLLPPSSAYLALSAPTAPVTPSGIAPGGISFMPAPTASPPAADNGGKPLPNVDDLLPGAGELISPPPASDRLPASTDADEAALDHIKLRDRGDWWDVPEFGESFKPGSPAYSLLGTLGAGPKAIKEIVNKHFPDVPVEVHGGSLLFKSKNGKEYAYRGGELQGSDLKRALYGAVLTAPALLAGGPGIVGAAAAGTAASGISELAKYAAGGGFDPSQLVVGGAMGAGVGAASKVARILGNFPAAESGAAAEAARTVDSSLAPAVDAAALEHSNAVAQAERAQAGHVAAQAQGARDTAATLSNVGEVAARAQTERDAAKGAVDVAKAAIPAPTTEVPNPAIHQLTAESEKLVQALGEGRAPGAVNKAAVDAVGDKLGGLQESFRGKYADVKKTVGAGKAYVEGFGKFIQDQAQEVGGYNKLPAWLKRAWRQVRPRIMKDGSTREAAYAMQVEVRKFLGDLAARRGPLANIGQERGLAMLARDAMAADQAQSAENLGAGKLFREAQAEAKEYFGLKKAATHFLSKDVEDKLSGDVTAKAGPAIAKLAKGELAPFNELMTALSRPGLEQLKPDVIRSMLSTKFGDITAGEAFQFGKFNKWMRSVIKEPGAYSALMNNLDPEGRQLVQDLSQASSGISRAMAEAGLQDGAQSAEQVALKEAQDRASEVVKRTGTDLERAKMEHAQTSRAATVAEKETRAPALELRQAIRVTRAKLSAAQKAFDIATAEAKKANKPGPLRKAVGYGSDFVSFIGGHMGFGGRVANVANRMGAGDKIMAMPGFRSIAPIFQKLMNAADVPPARWGQYLTESMATGAAGSPVRARITPQERPE